MNWLNQHKKAMILAASAAVFTAIMIFLASGRNKEPVKQAVPTETVNTEVKQEAGKDEPSEAIVMTSKVLFSILAFMKCEQGTEYLRQLRKQVEPMSKLMKCK